jgi:cob(I)alamin adenosyltransferase
MKDFYTRSGDDGKTGILGEGRVEKFDLRMEALGTLDELSAALGMARSFLDDRMVNDFLVHLQRELYEVMTEVSASPLNADQFHRVTEEQVRKLEDEIAHFSLVVEIPDGFILPGDSPASAGIAFARTIARRAERRVAELIYREELQNRELLRYLNRLSSLLFVLELYLIQQGKHKKPLMAKVEKA